MVTSVELLSPDTSREKVRGLMSTIARGTQGAYIDLALMCRTLVEKYNNSFCVSPLDFGDITIKLVSNHLFNGSDYKNKDYTNSQIEEVNSDNETHYFADDYGFAISVTKHEATKYAWDTSKMNFAEKPDKEVFYVHIIKGSVDTWRYYLKGVMNQIIEDPTCDAYYILFNLSHYIAPLFSDLLDKYEDAIREKEEAERKAEEKRKEAERRAEEARKTEEIRKAEEERKSKAKPPIGGLTEEDWATIRKAMDEKTKKTSCSNKTEKESEPRDVEDLISILSEVLDIAKNAKKNGGITGNEILNLIAKYSDGLDILHSNVLDSMSNFNMDDCVDYLKYISMMTDAYHDLFQNILDSNPDMNSEEED